MPFAAKQFGAALANHVLEHMASLEDLQAAWSELHRVADYVFIAVPGKGTIMGWLTPGHELWIKQVGEGTLFAQERNGLRRSGYVYA